VLKLHAAQHQHVSHTTQYRDGLDWITHYCTVAICGHHEDITKRGLREYDFDSHSFVGISVLVFEPQFPRDSHGWSRRHGWGQGSGWGKGIRCAKDTEPRRRNVKGMENGGSPLNRLGCLWKRRELPGGRKRISECIPSVMPLVRGVS